MDRKQPHPPAPSPKQRGGERAIRVCFAIDDLSRAGTETQLLALIRTLDRSRVRPSLVLLNGEAQTSRELEPADCPILRLGVTRLTSRHAIGAARRLLGFWRQHPPDILQAYFLDASYFTVPLAALAGVRKIVRVRNNLGYWLTRRHRLLNRLLAPLVHVSLTNSADGRRALMQADKLPVRRVELIENGVDVERFAGFALPDTTRPIVRIGCVANLRAVKNIDGLMRAAALLGKRFPHVRFEVAGEGVERRHLERVHAELQLGERFELVGGATDVPGFLQQLELFALPSHSEGMSNALLEAMAAGRAIVATRVGANERVLGDAGVLVPPGDDVALAEALGNLLADPLRTRQLGDMARQRVEAEFGRRAMTERFERFYRALAGSGPKMPGGHFLTYFDGSARNASLQPVQQT